MVQQQLSGIESTGSVAENSPSQLEIPKMKQTAPSWGSHSLTECPPNGRPRKDHCYPGFIDKETDLEKLSDLLKATQLLDSEAEFTLNPGLSGYDL